MILKIFFLFLGIIPVTALRHYVDLRGYEIFTEHNRGGAQPVNLNSQIELEQCCQFFRKKEIKAFKEMLCFLVAPALLPLCKISLANLKENAQYAPIAVIPIAISTSYALKKLHDVAINIGAVWQYEKELSKLYPPQQRSITFGLAICGYNCFK